MPAVVLQAVEDGGCSRDRQARFFCWEHLSDMNLLPRIVPEKWCIWFSHVWGHVKSIHAALSKYLEGRLGLQPSQPMTGWVRVPAGYFWNLRLNPQNLVFPVTQNQEARLPFRPVPVLSSSYAEAKEGQGRGS